MAAKAGDATEALVTVVKALEALSDSDRQWVLVSAASKYTMASPVTQVGTGPTGAGATTLLPALAGNAQAALAKKDPRAFIRAKKPTTDIQRVACLGYYIMQTTGNLGFTSKDVAKANTDSGEGSFNLPRAMDNATRAAKYISNRGPREKQLTALGEDVVNALPDQATVKTVEDSSKARRVKKKTRKAKKA
jgi:hypothetical protein